MSLIDDLREIADKIPVSHIPNLNELAPIVGALVGYVEHKETLLQAAQEGTQAVADLFNPPVEEAPPPAPAADVSASAPSAAEKDAQIAALEQQVANLQAQARRTTTSVEAAGPTVPPVGA